MRKIILFIAIFLSAAQTQAENSQYSTMYKVAVIGDSITEDGGYIKELGKLCPGYVFDNYGISGQQTWQILQRVRMMGSEPEKKLCGLEDYGQIIVLMGINNIDNPDRVISDLKKICAMAKSVASHPIRVVVMTLTPWKGYSTWSAQKQANWYKVNKFILSKPENADIVVDLANALCDPKDSECLWEGFRNPNDKLHPRGVGQIQIGRTVYKTAFDPEYLALYWKNTKY